MTTKKIKIRTRFFLAVEGEGEQSFVKWLQYLTDKNELHVHLDCQLLGGGGYEIMLNKALRYSRQKDRHKVKSSILLVDADRAGRDDNWLIDQLRETARKHKFEAIFQIPNQEGLLVRLLPSNERSQANLSHVQNKLRILWPDYKKPADARMLISKFSLDDLLRVSEVDAEIKKLLIIIGLSSK